MITSSKRSQLTELRQQIISDKVCPDLASQAQNLVFGEGSEDAEIVFIGEAPGKNEDIQGKPFVGAAGKFLDQMLDTIGLKRAQIYITNIVKYRPPNNRDPLPEEKAAFLPYLLKQIEIINPKLIVTLGRHSLNCFLPDLAITQVHGQPKRYKGRVYLPLYHPAAALYNGSLKQVLIEDFAQVPSILEIIK
ncbi:MAG TPA: uracil-DNA glycosylase [Candidatus Saccharimonadales bacterium]|nr:uracil-DNA glycosylase [Candidatus Saccharimonadales bacterium]